VSRLFDRRWRVAIDTIEFTELDIEFTVEKHLKAEPNTCTLVIYNLNEEHQSHLESLGFGGKAGSGNKKAFGVQSKKAVTGIPCRIEAGYKELGSQLIWLGDLRTVQTTFDGVDFTTTLTSGDGEKGWQNARIHVPFGPKTPTETALRAIVRALGVGEGNIGKFAHKLKMAGSAVYPAGKTLAGSAQRALMDFARSADLEISIQDSNIQILDRGQALAGEAILLDSEHGLLGSPTVDADGILTADAEMIPDVRCGRIVQMNAKRVKGAYKIAEVTYTGQSAGDDWGVQIRGPRY
jgi:hypothetical protein